MTPAQNSGTETRHRPFFPIELLLALALLGGIISINVVPSLFLVDDNNYLVNVLALQKGRVTIANTEGLPPSPELLFFEPGPRSRTVTSTPVASTAPPLYAPIALPFSWLRWRGLVGLSTLAYLATAAIIFLYVRRVSVEPLTPWLAAATFALGSFTIEYALGLWPHTLSLALCTGGAVMAALAIETGSARRAAIAGCLLGLAAGIRYQNAVIVAAVGVGTLLLANQRWRLLPAFGIMAAIPLTLSSFINHARFGSWNPISKGKGYLGVPVLDNDATSVFEPFVLFWAQVVDFTAWPPLLGPIKEGWVTYDTTTGAHLMLGVTLKKAIIQSAPWFAVALLLLGMAWSHRARIADAQRLPLRLFSIIAVAILIVFSMAGATRNDGLTFNARYLLELLPIGAMAFAWALDGLHVQRRPLAVGIGSGVLMVALILLGIPARGANDGWLWTMRQLAMLKTPLLLASLLTVAWVLARRSMKAPKMLAVTAGICLGWAFMLHMDDVVASQRIRRFYQDRTAKFAEVLPNHSAFIAWWGYKHAAGPLLFDRDIVILDAYSDNGKDAPTLIRHLLSDGRKVVLLADGFPPEVLEAVIGGFNVSPIEMPGLRLLELRPGALNGQ
jgi:hypothetical protein